MKFPISPKIFWPALVISGQLVLLIAGWGFYIATAVRPVALPDSTAEKAARSPGAVTLIITLLSTIIAVASSFLHSHSVRHALTCALTKSMPLHRLAMGIRLSRQRPLLSAKFVGWMVVTLVNLGILGAQTAAWNTLLTPRRIFIRDAVIGTGLDVSAPGFVQRASGLVRDPDWTPPDTALTVATVVQASGVAAVHAAFNFPASINFNELSFTNSTRGIMPVFLDDVPSSLSMNSFFTPTVRVDIDSHSPNGFSTNLTVMQQGMTIDVECSARDPSIDNLFVWEGTLPNGPNLVQGRSVVVEALCSDGNRQNSTPVTTQLGSGEAFGNAILMAFCRMESNAAYEAVIHALGNLYTPIGALSCVMTPKLTTVSVNYASTHGFRNMSDPNYVSVLETVSEEGIQDIDMVVGPFTFLLRHLQSTQTLRANSFGNILSEFFYRDPDRSVDTYQRIAAAYLTGVFEFSSTLLRGEFSRTNTDYWTNGETPDSLLYTIRGTYSTETMGWDNGSSNLVPALLIIPTLVAFAAITFVVSAMLPTGGSKLSPKGSVTNEMLRGQEYLDLGDFMHVLAVSHPNGNLPSLEAGEGEFMQYGQQTFASLATGSVPGQIRLLIN